MEFVWYRHDIITVNYVGQDNCIVNFTTALKEAFPNIFVYFDHFKTTIKKRLGCSYLLLGQECINPTDG